MIDWLSKKQREKKQKEAHELELRNSLAQKVSQFEQSYSRATGGFDGEDFTDLLIDGVRVRVAKEEITIYDV